MSKLKFINASLLLGVTFCAHFLYFREFTLYEDDLFHIASSFELSAWDLFYSLRYYFIEWPQGRPIHFSIPAVATFVSMRLGGLDALYLLAYSIVAANTLLFYALIKKVAPTAVALAGAFAFCLFPADTTKSFLTHSFCLQPALTFLLVSSICYLNGRTFIALLLLPGCLLTYETTLLPILAVPLLSTPWNYRDIEIKYRNFIVILFIFALVIAYRFVNKESRILELFNDDLFQVIIKSLFAIVQGTFTVYYSFIYRIYSSITAITVTSFIIIVIFVVFIWVAFYKNIAYESRQLIQGIWNSNIKKSIKINIQYSFPVEIKDAFQLFFAGFMAVILSYPLAFNDWSKTALQGRGTCVHLASTFGVSICIAALVWILLIIFFSLNIKKTLALLIALYFSLIIGFHINVQNSFRKASRVQSEFWHNILVECQDVEDGTIAFILWPDRDWGLYIMPWATQYVFEKLYAFPKSWKNPPNVYVLENDPERHNISEKNGIWFYDEPWQGGKKITITPENTILLVYKNKKMNRYSKPTYFPSFGESLNFKPIKENQKIEYDKKILYYYLVEGKSDFDFLR